MSGQTQVFDLRMVGQLVDEFRRGDDAHALSQGVQRWWRSLPGGTQQRITMGSRDRLRARRRLSFFEKWGWAVVYTLGGVAAWFVVGGVVSVILGIATGGVIGFDLVICPVTLLAPGVAIVSLVVVGSRIRDRDFALVMCEPLCPTCGYSTEGRQSLKCPECGFDDPRARLPAYVLVHLREDAVRDVQRAAWGPVAGEVRRRAASEWWRRRDRDPHGAARLNVVLAGTVGAVAVGLVALFAVGVSKGAVLEHALIVGMATVLGYLGVAALARRIIGEHAVRTAILAGRCAVCGLERPRPGVRHGSAGREDAAACPGCGTPEFVADETVVDALAKRYHRHASLFALSESESAPAAVFTGAVP